MIKKTTLLKFLLRQIFLLSLLLSGIIYAQTGPNDDFDGDGIINSVDLDDDNDGIPDKIECPAAFTNLVNGGGFTTSPTSNWYFSNSAANYDATTGAFAFGYSGTQTNSTLTGGLFDQVDGNNTNTGSFNALMEMNGTTDALVSRLNQPLIAGATYQFSFDAGLRGGAGTAGQNCRLAIYNADTNTLETIVISEPLTSLPVYPNYKTLTGTYTATTSGNYYLLFLNAGNGGTANDYIIDRVAAIGSAGSPNVCDTDGDGFPNHMDLDSDNDGCSDSFEGGAISTETTNNQFPAAPDTNGNGLNDTKENLGTPGTVNYPSTYTQYAISSNISLCSDIDNDGIFDLTDIDDDNDGIPDVIESPACFYTENEAKVITSVSTDLLKYDVYIIANSFDGNTGTMSAFDLNQNWVGKSIFEIMPATPLAISTVNFDVDTWYISNGAASTFKLQGWNGLIWVDLSAPMANATLVDFSISNTLQVGVKYIKYRIVGVAGTSYYSGVREITLTPYQFNQALYPKPTCTTDTDGDGVRNHQDLDSDGDGCSDLAESEVSPVTDVSTPTSITNNNGTSYGIAADKLAGSQLNPNGTDTNNNGLNDSVENGTTGTVSYPSTYIPYAIGSNYAACADTDGDGILDINDIDDDNDGVLDAVESPSCFSTAAEIAVPQSVTTQVATTGAIANVYDNNTATTFAFTNNSTKVNLTVFEITPSTTLKASALYIRYSTATANALGTTASSVSVDGWNGTAWMPLQTYTPGAAVANVQSFAIPSGSQAVYTKYRLQGLLGTVVSTGIITEVGLTAASDYIPSAHPKPTCINDLDGDGIPNHRDLDSDGDGCSDSVEAGNTVFTANNTTTYNTGTDANNNGLLDQFESATTPGTINYNSTYSVFAINPAISGCLDSDGDTIPDVSDIDDDNDGVLDTVEANCVSVASLGDPTISAVNGTVRDYNEFSYWESAQQVVIDYPYSFQNFNALFWSVDTSDNYTVSVKLDDGTVVGPLDGRMFSSTSDPSWVSRWTTKGYPVAPSDVNWNSPLSELTGSPFNPGEVYYTSSYPNNLQKSWGAVEFTVPQTNYVNGIDQIILTIKPGIGATAFVEIEPLNIVSSCSDLDTDNDGIPNRLDLDSDGDGCPDAVEAGTATQAGAGNTSAGTLVNTSGTQTGVANAIVGNNTPAAYGTNGFYSGIETNDTSSAAYTGIYSYNQYAIVSTLNLCTDTDGDGIIDLNDIDDDNDGIVDAVESPACFYTAAEANVISKITSQFTSPDDDQIDGDIQLLHDGATAFTFNFNPVAATANPTGSNLFTIEYPTSLQLATLSVSQRISAMANANAVVVGSNDGVTWSAALSPATLITTTPTVFNITTTQPYKYYRIQTGSVPGALAATNTIGEITSTVAASYIPSAHQKPVICSVDTDGDTIPNHLDLDSDGDGCSDLAESGVSPATDIITPLLTNNAGGSYGIANPNGSQLNPTAADVNNDGLNDSVDADLNSITNYTSTYSNAINAAIASCTLFCYRPAVLSGTVLSTPQGITSLHRAGVDADNWPMVRKGAWTALEAKTKGFVPNRLTLAQINLIPAGDLREGMMVYNISSDCLYINTDGTPTGWKCFNTQACPD